MFELAVKFKMLPFFVHGLAIISLRWFLYITMGGAMIIKAVLLVNYVMVFTWSSSKCPFILASYYLTESQIICIKW